MKSFDLEGKLDKNFHKAMCLKFDAKVFDKEIIISTCEEIKKVYNYN